MDSLHLPFDRFFFFQSAFFLGAKVLINLMKEIFCFGFFYPNIFGTCFLTCGLLDLFFCRPELWIDMVIEKHVNEISCSGFYFMHLG